MAIRPDYGHSDYQDSMGYNSYQPPREESPEPYHRHRQDRYSDSHSRSRDRSSKSRGGTDREKSSGPGSRVKDELKKHKDVGASALGALAGGIIGNELGGGRGKIGLLIGAAIGGIGGNMYERKHAQERTKRQAAFRRGKQEQDDELEYDSY